MEALFTKITAIDERIKEVEVRIKDTEKATYYSIFGTEHKREEKIKDLKRRQKRLISMKYKTLESLQIAIGLEKCDLSEKERELTLKMNI